MLRRNLLKSLFSIPVAFIGSKVLAYSSTGYQQIKLNNKLFCLRNFISNLQSYKIDDFLSDNKINLSVITSTWQFNTNYKTIKAFVDFKYCYLEDLDGIVISQAHRLLACQIIDKISDLNYKKTVISYKNSELLEELLYVNSELRYRVSVNLAIQGN